MRCIVAMFWSITKHSFVFCLSRFPCLQCPAYLSHLPCLPALSRLPCLPAQPTWHTCSTPSSRSVSPDIPTWPVSFDPPSRHLLVPCLPIELTPQGLNLPQLSQPLVSTNQGSASELPSVYYNIQNEKEGRPNQFCWMFPLKFLLSICSLHVNEEHEQCSASHKYWLFHNKSKQNLQSSPVVSILLLQLIQWRAVSSVLVLFCNGIPKRTLAQMMKCPKLD